jgi:hypothetical protein
MNGPEKGASEIFKAMKATALGSLDSTGVLKRLVTTYVMSCEVNAKGPQLEADTLRRKYKALSAELGKAESLLSETPSDVERGQKVADIRRTMGQVNRDGGRAGQIAGEWVTHGRQVGQLLTQELGG